MRACCLFLYLLAATFALSVKSKPHGKHQKTLMVAKDKDFIREEGNEPRVAATLIPLEESSKEQEVEELSSENNVDADKDIRGVEMPERSSKSKAALMSEEDLAESLEEEAQEEPEGGERELEEEEEAEMEEGKERLSEDQEKVLNEKLETEDAEEEADEDEELIEEDAKGAEMLDKEEIDVEMMPLERKMEKTAQTEERGALFEDSDGSSESEIPADLDYAADSVVQALHTSTPPEHPDSRPLPETGGKEQQTSAEELPTASDDLEPEPADGGEVSEDDPDDQAPSKDPGAHEQGPKLNRVSPDPQEGSELLMSKAGGKEEEKSARHSKRKAQKQKKNHRVRKHFPQSEQAQSGPEPSHQESESSSAENSGSKAKRRRAGKWGSIVGMNPVQIRATVDLYPSSRAAPAAQHPEAAADPCTNFPCKRGKTCKLDADNKPGCVCQRASECPPAVNDFDRVCGTDNHTYESSCQLFATKCNLEGTKRGHRLHLDYTGACKHIPSCRDSELVQFPLRMRDWLKNVLLQLYEHDSSTSTFLTPKQRLRVKKIFESERRLHAGNHSVELLAQDFEKNYNMYIYPVHWQFAQLDQHPSDRSLSHSELAPLRVPLVPMEHCTSRFFQECDADKDKQVSLKEWTSCFGIKNEDMDVNQLF